MKHVTILITFEDLHNEDLAEKADDFVLTKLKAKNMNFLGGKDYEWECEIPDEIANEYEEDHIYHEDGFEYSICFQDRFLI